jgi:hypothetical protein
MGDADSNDYTTVKITGVEIGVMSDRVYFSCIKGHMDSGSFMEGILAPERFEVPAADVAGMKTTVSLTDETWWDINKRVLYQWLIDNHYPGTVT